MRMTGPVFVVMMWFDRLTFVVSAVGHYGCDIPYFLCSSNSASHSSSFRLWYAIHSLVTLAQNGPGNLDRGWKN